MIRPRPHPPAAAQRRHGALLLLLVALGWGLNWPAMKHLLTELPPLLARSSAGLAAAAGLALLTLLRGESLAVPRPMRGRLLLAACANVFVWMGLPTLALRWLSAGQGALLVYTMPAWATLLAWPMLGQRPGARAIAGLAACFAGLWLLLGASAMPLDAGHLGGAALSLAAALVFAAGTLALPPIIGVAPVALVSWQLALGCAPMLAISLLAEPLDSLSPSPLGWALLAYMTAVPMGACYLMWFAALRRVPATTAASATLLVPVIGVGAGALLLGEPFGEPQLAALALTLGGVALAMGAAPARRVEAEAG